MTRSAVSRLGGRDSALRFEVTLHQRRLRSSDVTAGRPEVAHADARTRCSRTQLRDLAARVIPESDLGALLEAGANALELLPLGASASQRDLADHPDRERDVPRQRRLAGEAEATLRRPRRLVEVADE